MALDMAMSSIDISFFTLPLCFHTMGFVIASGFYFYLLFFSLMASQCYIELKKLSTIARPLDFFLPPLFGKPTIKNV